MKKLIIALLLGSIVSFSVVAQNYTQIVKGKIIDLDTQSPLPGATILLLNSDPLIGTTSDENGNFKLANIPVGRQNFKITFVGYEDVFLNEIIVGTGHEVILNIKMKESVNSIQEVVIKANIDKSRAINSMATVSSRQITIEETSRIAAGISDPGRTVQSFAGVACADDENNEIVVRGNSPRGISWRMEGIEIPNPNHFSNGEGGSGGGISVLSTQVLANSDFMTGAFPAEYGNALSGVFDLSLRKGNFDKREYAVQAGLLGVQLAAEGPIIKGTQASYLFNYRYSTLALLNKVGFDLGESDVDPTYQDISFNINLPTKKMGRFTIFGLGGLSTAGDIAIKDSLKWEYRSDIFNETEDHTVALTGITHNYLFKNNKTYIKTAGVYSFSNNSLIEDTLGINYISGITRDEDLDYLTLTVNSFINHKFNSKHVVRFGMAMSNKSFNLKFKGYNWDENLLETKIENSGNTNLYEAYLQWKYRITPKIDINSGLHYTYLALNKDYTIEPRVGIKWNINDKHSINFGAGLHSKAEPISIYMAEAQLADGTIITPNKNVKITKAVHTILGYNWNFGDNYRLKTEIYYQYLYDVPVKDGDTTGVISALNFSSGFTNEKFVNKGTGRNYGIELTLEKFFSHNYYFMLTSSLFESKYTIPGFKERNTLFNSKYILNCTGGKEFAVGKNKQSIFGVNIRAILRGGYRTIPIDLEESRLQGEEIRIYDQAFETKAPDYYRIDLGVSYRKNKPNYAWILSIDLQNLTNRSNIWDQSYNSESGKLQNTYMVGLIPVINYRVEF